MDDKKIVKLAKSTGDYSLISKHERDYLIKSLNRNKSIEEIEDFLFEKYKEYYAKDLFDYLNHSFDLLLDFNKKDVLNIGCGEGSESIFFAKFGAKKVIALDNSKERLRFLKAHSRNLKLDRKIKPIAGDFTKTDFKDSSFDIITMIGVLEWLPKKDPYSEQLSCLKKARNMLKNKGTFLLAIENRYCPLYFTGKTNHGDLPFTPLMPRFLSNFITLWIKKKKYLTYTYSYKDYKKIFKEAGYKNIQVYPVIFSYQEPRFIINSKKAYKILLRKFGVHPIINLGAKLLSILPSWLLLRLSPSYIILGEK